MCSCFEGREVGVLTVNAMVRLVIQVVQLQPCLIFRGLLYVNRAWPKWGSMRLNLQEGIVIAIATILVIEHLKKKIIH